METATIDADVHETLSSYDTLVPYLEPHWRHYITEFRWRGFGVAMPWSGIPAYLRPEWELEDGIRGCTSIDRMRKDVFEEQGVEVAVTNNLSAHFGFMRGWHEFAAALAAAYNRYQIEQWLEPEPRLRGSVHIVPHDPAQAAREIDEAGAHPQMVQVALPVITDREYGDPFYRPIFDAAVRNGLAVTLHHGEATESLLGFTRYFIIWHTIAMPQAIMCQLASMLFNGIFDLFPDLRVCGIEGGFTWMPSFMSRADRQFEQFRHEVPWVKERPSDHLRRHVRLSTQPMEHLAKGEFLVYLDQMGSDEMLMFATDYPHHDADDVGHTLPGGLDDELVEKLMWRNALDAFPRLGAEVRA